MSYRAMHKRMSYIDQRLRHRQDYPSANDIVQSLEREYGETCSKRTVQRDIERMAGDGAPIEYDPHRHGYYYTDLNWQLPAFNLTEGDLMALMVADRALEGYRNSPYHDELLKVFERMTALLPERVTVSSEDLAANITVISDPTTRITAEVWAAIRDGLYRTRKVTLWYRSPGYSESVPRQVNPLHLVGHRGEWYLLCWSHHHEQIRIFALNRIERARVDTAKFAYPTDFRADDYIDPAFGVFVNEGMVDVAIRFDGDAASKIPERRWHSDQTIETLQDGGIVLRFRTNQQSQLLFWVSQWGPSAEILEPAELRDRAREWFRETAARYQG
ncbi:helix-turn-helix transcriptional regulator [Spirochaeta africana]|uniref:Putative transcriptional regulator n=1 Tax=Spirochaeta africana (strain ATCC 700263 / DSM 8902 / Z-7692) TaxID=889378 RepID=H9UHK5_SPIAZ|nr:WYL domain-containing transcriptional regulator [Spirochaeta africana]AFG36998.1 putative transcriptional regulator [Spirochaeta africana DSM 8902]